jgi:RNA polymerase sigma-70 factor (ECF subfamily)
MYKEYKINEDRARVKRDNLLSTVNQYVTDSLTAKMVNNEDLHNTKKAVQEKHLFQQATNGGEIIDAELFIKNTFTSDYLKGYELLFKRYYQPLCSHAARFVYSRTIAEDLVMDVFSKFWQTKGFLDITCSYRAYLFTSVRYAAYAYLRQEFGKDFAVLETSEYPLATLHITQSTPHQILQYHELQAAIEVILKTIPPQSQRVFIMSRFEGKKNAMIAEELSISLKTVEGHMTKALAILRISLKNAGYIGFVIGVSHVMLVGQA